MDVATLSAFIAVAESGSFSNAAERLYLTQPAVSKRIAALEQELATELFDRVGRRVVLTEAGRLLLPRAQRILNELQDARRSLSNLAGTVGGSLSVGTSHHIGLHRLPPVLRRYVAEFPDVELDLHFMDSEAACRAVEHGELELAVVTLPTAAAAQLRLQPVWEDQLVTVVGPDHDLATRKRVSLEQLAVHPAILPGRETFTRQIVDEALAPLDLQIDVRLSTNYLETIKMLVAIGLGWSMLPHTMVDAELHPLAVQGLQLRRQLGVVRHARRTLSNAALALIDFVDATKDAA
jgi:DNA-binding transcriptional LysR family regulator